MENLQAVAEQRNVVRFRSVECGPMPLGRIATDALLEYRDSFVAIGERVVQDIALIDGELARRAPTPDEAA